MSGQEFYLYILHSNLINFLIVLSTIIFVFKKFKLGKIIDSIAEDIKTNVKSSSEAVENALIEYKKTKKESRGLEEKKNKIIENAKSIIENLKEANLEKIEEKQNIMEQNAEKLMKSYKSRKIQKTAEKIQQAVYTLSLSATKELMNDDIQKQSIMNALDEFDNLKGVL